MYYCDGDLKCLNLNEPCLMVEEGRKDERLVRSHEEIKDEKQME
jgi:hypothetical protein